MDDLIFSSLIMSSTASPKAVYINGLDACDTFYEASEISGSTMTSERSNSSMGSDTDSLTGSDTSSICPTAIKARKLAFLAANLLKASGAVPESGTASDGLVIYCRARDPKYEASNREWAALVASGKIVETRVANPGWRQNIDPTLPNYQRYLYNTGVRTIYPDDQPLSFKALHEQRSKAINASYRKAGFTPPAHVQECLRRSEEMADKESKKSWIRRQMSQMMKSSGEKKRALDPVPAEYKKGKVCYKD